VRPALEPLVGDSREPLVILLGAVGLVLLIACANIANLLLARTLARQREMSVRAALGASRWRVLRQLLTESVLLAVLGGAAGMIVAGYALSFLLPIGGESIPRLAQAALDARVFAFSLGLALLASVVFGMAPALQASRIDLTSALNQRSRGDSQRHDRIRSALVVAQVALGLVLVSGAGLLMSSFLHLEKSDLGLKTDHLLTFWFSLPDQQYNPTQQLVFYDQLLQRVAAVPGVQSAAGVWPLPLGGDNATVTFNIEERPETPSNRPGARMAFTTPAYFSTARIPLLKGRTFTQYDDAKAPRVLVVNKAFADKYFPGENVIGKRITPGATGPGDSKETPHEIVGVVGNAKLFALDPEPQPIYYFPYKQLAWQSPVMMLRTTVDPHTLQATLRKQVSALDPLVPVFQMYTMEDLLSTQITAPRFQTSLLGCFAGIALLLTMVGLYGVIAYSVTRRINEIGIRIALGASRRDVLAMVLRKAALLIASGLLLGLAGSIAGDRLLTGMLHGVSALDPTVLALSTLIVILTGLMAAFIPARRAAAVQPMTALRHD
jgi:putative ABC transport system permease protein